MSREIKFRAWDAYSETMLAIGEFDIFHEEDNGFHSGYTDGEGDWQVNVLMQWTGIKDKNGVEIYEGDILRVDNPVGSPPVSMFIEFSDLLHGWLLMNGSEIHAIPTRQQMEIIGNIHENPELLQPTK